MKKFLPLVAAIALAAATPAAAGEPPLVIDDFEDLSLEAATGLSWTALGDWLVGGASSGEVSVAHLAEGERSLGALRLAGHLRPGPRGAGYAGAWISLRADGTPRDLTPYRALRFRVRGTPGSYRGGVRRSENKAQANLMAPFTVTAAWSDVELPLASLVQEPASPSPMAYAPTGVAWLGITSGDDSPRDFQLELDDVTLAPGGPDQPAAPWSLSKLRLTDPRSLARLTFASAGKDGRGDGVSPRLPDARELQVAVDPADGRVWFRFILDQPPPEAYLGMNIALDVDGDPADGAAWWGQNKGFHYDRLCTAYLSRGAGYWQGMLGVADAAQAAAGRLAGTSADVRVAIDPARRTVAIGVPRAALGLPPGGKVRLVGTVGSNFTFNDDIPAAGALEAVVPDAPARATISN